MPEPYKNLLTYLSGLGFTKHPFVQKSAEEDEKLPDYFVARGYFGSVLGAPDQATTTIYFAARGKGKTATARMVHHLLTQTRDYGPVLVVNFGRRDFRELLQKADGDFTRLKPEEFHHRLLKLAQQALHDQWEWLQGFEQVQKAKPALKEIRPDELGQVLRRAGLCSAYFLVDGVDELVETMREPERGADLVLPLLSDLDLLEMEHLAFKFFLPLELEEIIHRLGLVRFDRIEALTDRVEWRSEELQQLLSNRLLAFSSGAINSLAQYSDMNDLDLRMCQAAYGSPRNLLRLGGYLLQEHLEEGLPEKISENALEQAINRLKKALATEKGYSSVSLPEPEPDQADPPLPTPAVVVKQDAPPSATSAVVQAGNAIPLLLIDGNDVYLGGERVENPPSGLELKLLNELYKAHGKTRSKDELIKAVYPEGIASDEQLNATVKRLRRKLKDTDEKYIKTIRGTGFLLCNFKE